MKISLIFFFYLLPLNTIYAQENKLLSPEELKNDVYFYFQTLFTKHPNPYYYYSLNEFEDKKNEIYSQLNKPLTCEQFAWVIGEMNSFLDMHSLIHIYFQTHWRVDPIKLFPIVDISNDKIYLKDFTNEIEEINGMKASDIIYNLKKYINWKLPYERNKYSMKAYFSNFIYNKYNIQAPFRVKFSKDDRVYLIDGLSMDNFVEMTSYRGVPGYSYKIYPKSSIAIFNIAGFRDFERKKFHEKLKEFSIKIDSLQIRNIFYDMTMNPGGHYIGVEALDVIKHDTVFLRCNQIVHSDFVNKKFKLNEIVLAPNNRAAIPRDRKLFVLQGVNTASGGDYFCRIVANNKLGTLVGQKTGEPTVAFSSSPSYTMPHSKITFSVAQTLWDFSDYFGQDTLEPDLYWDVNHCREFTEQELIEITNKYDI